MENQMQGRGTEADFWKQMYEQVAEKQKTEHKRAEAYKARAFSAEMARNKFKKALWMIGIFAAASLNGIYWICQIGGIK